MNVRAGAYSSRGGVRPLNEDSFLASTQTGGGGIEDTGAAFEGAVESPLFFLVADGMGGHAAGDRASAFVSQKMKEASEEAEREHRVFDGDSIEALVQTIHAALVQEGENRGTPNMGSTLTGIVLQKDSPCGFFNAGDSRVYRLRGVYLQQLSRDDSLAGIVPGAAKNIITNAVGAGLSGVTVASRFSDAVVAAGDVFLMCSDGVHGFVSGDDLEKMLGEELPPREVAQKIVEAAIANDSDDNCTAVVVRIVEEADG